jgi:Transglutaminase-like superfamily
MREGLQSRIQIGVSKDAGRFEAQAWVESQDRVVIGDSGLQRFTPYDGVGMMVLKWPIPRPATDSGAR